MELLGQIGRWARNNVLGLIAIFIALTGTAVGAGIASHTAAPNAVSRSATRQAETASRRGPRGPAGPPGPAGPQGAAGQNGTNGGRGPSDAWFNFNNGPTTIGQTASPTTLDTITPAAGGLAVFGKVGINWATPMATSGAAKVTCDLNEGGALRDEAVAWVGNLNSGGVANPDATMNLQYANIASGAAVTLTCSQNNAVFTSAATAVYAKITAIQVATLH